MRGFFNTIKLRGKKLKKSKEKAKGQDETILSFFKLNSGLLFTPCEVHEMLYDNNTPLTSVRRSISTLTSNGKLEQTATQKTGNYGVLNHCWTLKK